MSLAAETANCFLGGLLSNLICPSHVEFQACQCWNFIRSFLFPLIVQECETCGTSSKNHQVNDMHDPHKISCQFYSNLKIVYFI